jgi:hypothetical protein
MRCDHHSLQLLTPATNNDHLQLSAAGKSKCIRSLDSTKDAKEAIKNTTKSRQSMANDWYLNSSNQTEWQMTAKM